MGGETCKVCSMVLAGCTGPPFVYMCGAPRFCDCP
jgi:hypothetical protein